MNQTITRRPFNWSHASFKEVVSSILPHPRIFAGANAFAVILPMLAGLIAAILLIAQ